MGDSAAPVLEDALVARRDTRRRVHFALDATGPPLADVVQTLAGSFLELQQAFGTALETLDSSLREFAGNLVETWRRVDELAKHQQPRGGDFHLELEVLTAQVRALEKALVDPSLGARSGPDAHLSEQLRARVDDLERHWDEEVLRRAGLHEEALCAQRAPAPDEHSFVQLCMRMDDLERNFDEEILRRAGSRETG